jgi:hypothetical protein
MRTDSASAGSRLLYQFPDVSVASPTASKEQIDRRRDALDEAVGEVQAVLLKQLDAALATQHAVLQPAHAAAHVLRGRLIEG